MSGTLARKAVDEGRRVWTVTRGLRPVPSGVTPIVVDRLKGAAFEEAIRGADEEWDLIVDCICYHPEVAQLDAELFLADDSLCDSFVLISTDFVYHPDTHRFPQDEAALRYLEDGYGYEKRRSELILSERAVHKRWTILPHCRWYPITV